MKAFVYMRVSGLSQVEGMGFNRQEAACNDYATKNSIEIVKVYREEGVSGKTELDGRPALCALIADLLSTGTKMVLVERLDRLARDLIVQETIIQDLRRREVQIISVAEPDLCSDDPTRTLIRQILGAFFSYERKMIVAKLADARLRMKKQNGKCEGRKAFGDKDGEKVVLDTILTHADNGCSPESIAGLLNHDHIPTRYGRRWNSGTIHRILKRHA